MTDNEIIKALEYCAYREGCENCPITRECDGYVHLLDALDLINRQKAEIERLKKEKKHLERKLNRAALEIMDLKAIKAVRVDDINFLASLARAEAIVDFGKLLKERGVSVQKVDGLLEKLLRDRIWLYGCVDLTEMERRPEPYSRGFVDGTKDFVRRLCEGRVSNDPIVIAVKAELKEMERERE